MAAEAWDECFICPDDLVTDKETGHVGTVSEVRGEHALVNVPLLGEHWIPVDDLDLALRQGRRT